MIDMILSPSITHDDPSLPDIDIDELYNRYWEILCSTVVLATGDHSASRDIVQELFIDIWENRDQLQVAGSLHKYILANIRDRISHYQHHKDEREQVWKDYELVTGSLIYPGEMMEDNPIRNIAKEVIETAVAALPVRMRYIIMEHLYHSKSIHDLSGDMNITPQAVKIQLTKALHRIEAFIRNNLVGGQS
jgi:RNA polymerase sigma factor (sigma-70 family)